jgi:hypothetical protein
VALSAEERATLERWYGPIGPGEEEDVEARVDRLGGAHGAALELLLRDYAEMTRSPTRVSGGDDRSDHTDNLKPLEAQVAKLQTFLASGVVTVSEAVAGLLAEVSALSGAEYLTELTVTTTGGNRRA